MANKNYNNKVKRFIFMAPCENHCMLFLTGGNKLLFIPLNGIGDNLMFLPAACSLKAQFPDVEIHFLSNEHNDASNIMRHSPYIDKVIEFKFKGNEYTAKEYLLFFAIRYIPLLLKLKKEKYNYVFSINPNFLIKAISLLFNKRNIITRTNRSMNQTENGMRLLEKVNNSRTATVPNSDLLIFQNENQVLEKYSLKKEKYILFSFYCSSDKRSFSNYHSITKTLKDKINGSYTLVMIGKSGSHKADPDCVDLINKTTIQEAAIIVKNAKLLVAVDGGLMHLGIVQNVPIIAIFKTIHSRYRSPINSSYSYFKAIDKLNELETSNDPDTPISKNHFEPHDENQSAEIIKETLKYLKLQF